MPAPLCNICGSGTFEAYRDRPGERCPGCGSKARHRVALDVYRRFLPARPANDDRVLHLAPEACLHGPLQAWFGDGYVTADADPGRYPHARAIRLFVPDDLRRFPDGYFAGVLHNHVLEHIPGHYGDHMRAFARIVRPGGTMIFSVPGPYMDMQTVEGGEYLASDRERRERFRQEDHYKLLGNDFVTFLERMPGGRLLNDGMTDARRGALSVRPGKARFFVWQKDE